MARHASALKRARQNDKRRLRNQQVKSALRTVTKKAVIAISDHDADASSDLVQEACRAWDKAVTKSVVHANTAARNKSRLSTLFNEMMAKGPKSAAAVEASKASKRAARRKKKVAKTSKASKES